MPCKRRKARSGAEPSALAKARLMRLLSRFRVHALGRERRELLVGRFFFLEVLGEHAGAIVAAKLLGPRDQRAVTRDLVVLDGLRSRDQPGVQRLLVLD